MISQLICMNCKERFTVGNYYQGDYCNKCGYKGLNSYSLQQEYVKEMRKQVNKAKKSLDPKRSKDGKLNLASLALHPMFEELLAIVAEASIEKGYEPMNWLDPDNAVSVMKLLSAAKRHQNKFIKGIDLNDEETTLDGTPCKNKTNHLVYAAYSLLMAAVIVESDIKELDDRVLGKE